jgi:toxin ParE1/3/4
MAARRRVVWTEQARRSLNEVLAYIARDSPRAAARFLVTALDAASSLDVSSERGRLVPELEDPHVRELFVHRYRLIYEVGATEVTILAFLHGARDFAKWRRGE